MTITIDASSRGDNARDFMAIIDDTLDALDAIERDRVGSDRELLGWQIVEVTKENPFKLTIASIAGLTLFGSFVGGVHDIEHAPARPFVAHAMRAIERLGGRLDEKREITVKFETPDGIVAEPTGRLYDHAKQALGDRFYDVPGSVDGVLDLIGVTKQYQFVLYDDTDGHRINCKFSEDMLKQVKSMLGQRVTVIGSVRYRTTDDSVTRIAAEEIEFLGGDNALRFSELPEIDLAPGESSEDYIRRLRDAE